MRYWWVSQNKTYKEEMSGGFLWSPKNDSIKSYKNMTLCEPGDIVFSYYQQKISDYGLVISKAESYRKPMFASSDNQWDDDGWLVGVKWHELNRSVAPKDIVSELKPLLPEKHAPLDKNFNGVQAYLFEITKPISDLIFKWSQSELEMMDLSLLEEMSSADILIVNKIEGDASLSETEKLQIIKARKGQGKFKENLKNVETGCRFTGIKDDRFLIASHIKPWSHCESNHERLDGNNGLLLSPNIDRLFDRGFISLEDDGSLKVKDDVSVELLALLGLSANINIGPFSAEQKKYLAYHRTKVFK